MRLRYTRPDQVIVLNNADNTATPAGNAKPAPANR
jgi:hypothetical protein